MENLKTFFKKSDLKFSGNLFGFGTSPEADWKVIFILSAILAVSFVGFSVYIFIKIDKGEIFLSENLSQQNDKVLDTNLLKESAAYYKNKAVEFAELKNVGIPAVDPSL